MNKRTPIVYVIDKMPRAGTQSHLVEVFQTIDKDKYEPTLICLEEKMELGLKLEEQGFNVIELNVKNWKSVNGIKGLFTLRSLLKKLDTKIIHCYLFTASVFAVLAAKLAGVDIIITSRRDLGSHLSSSQISLLNFANRLSHCVVSNSKAVKDAALELEKNVSSIHPVIYNGLEPKAFKASRNYRKDLPNDALVLGTLSNIRSEKDPVTLLKSFVQVNKQRPNSYLLYAGVIKDQNLFDQLTNIVEENDLQNHVKFVGGISDVDEFLSSLDLFVFCSQSEGFSNAVLEAMSIGLPVVASNVGGNPEQVAKGCGDLFELGDIDGCVRAINNVLEQDYKLIGTQAQKRVIEEFSVKGMLNQMQDLYRDLARA